MEIVKFIYFYCNQIFNYFLSNYPSSRVTKDSNGDEMGVPGTLSLLQNVGLSSQPLSGFDWSPDKLGLAVSTSFDQTVRVTVCTKLNSL